MIAGWVIALITFPGVILHEYGHKKFCDWTKTVVYRVKYFQFFSQTAGYVVHAEPVGLKSSFLITIGPLIINTIICLFLPFIGLIIGMDSWFGLLLVWIGLSAGMNAFPSDTDADNFLQKVKGASEKNTFIFYTANGFSILVQLANVLKFVWFDLWYAIVIALVLPNLITKILL